MMAGYSFLTSSSTPSPTTSFGGTMTSYRDAKARSNNNARARIVKNKIKMSPSNNRERERYRTMLLKSLTNAAKGNRNVSLETSTMPIYGKAAVAASPPPFTAPIIMKRPTSYLSSQSTHTQAFQASLFSINNFEPPTSSRPMGIAQSNRFSLNNFETPISNRPMGIVQSNRFSALDSFPPRVTSAFKEDSIQKEPSPELSSKMKKLELWTPGEKSSEFKKLVSNNRFNDILNSKRNEPEKRNSIGEDPYLINHKLERRDELSSKKVPLFTKIKSLLAPKNLRSKLSSLSSSLSFLPYFHTTDHVVAPENLFKEPKLIEEREVFPELTPDMKSEMQQALGSSDLLVNEFKISIYSHDLKTLLGRNWLNDNVMDFYFNLIAHRSTQPQPDRKLPKVYVFSIFFYSRLLEGKESGRWLRRINLLDFDLIYIPIILHSHWRLVVIDIERKVMQYYDSLGNGDMECVQLLADFFYKDVAKKAEALNQKCCVNLEEWQLIGRSAGIPLQKNSFDCGVFACKYAEYLSRRAPITFDQSNIPLFRETMIYEILKIKLLT